MNRSMPSGIVAALAIAVSSAAIAQVEAQAQDGLLGTWRNAKNTVHVRTGACGNRVCGVVTWATDKAKADARRGGTPNLIGTTVFKDFRRVKPNIWRGRVFVPDIGATFSGTLTIVDGNRLRGSGCLVGRIGCKTRTWSRVS